MANSSSIVRGQELMLFYNNESIAFATSHTLTVTGNTADISSKDHGAFAASTITSISWEVSSENLYTDDQYNKLFDLMVNKREPISIIFGHYSNDTELATLGIVDSEVESWTAPTASTVYYEGKAYLTSLTANAANGDNATFSVTLSGVGKLEQKNYTE